jgi:serine/threonine protein kinase
MEGQRVTRPAPAPGDVVAGYTIVAELGSGPMSVVYRARDPGGGDVALKLLHPERGADASLHRRFIRETEIAGRLKHPNLLPVVAEGEDEGRAYMALPFAPGGSLADRLEDDGPLELPDLVGIVRDVGAGLDALHRLGLVHRDVKPSNVLFTETGAALADFGVARGADDSVLTRAGSVVGTVDYLAPETIRGEPAGPLSDLYALGCLAYACAVGTPPFADRRTVADICRAQLDDAPIEPAVLRPELPNAFTAALLTALAKDPADRPGTGTAYGLLLRAGARGA